MGRFDHLAARLALSSETALPPITPTEPLSLAASLPDRAATHLRKREAQHCAVPAALGEPIHPDPTYRPDCYATASVAAPAHAGGAYSTATDPLAILSTQGLELAGDDRAFIRQHLMGMMHNSRRDTLDQYARIWLAAMERKPEHQQQNAGRFAANTWLQSCTP